MWRKSRDNNRRNQSSKIIRNHEKKRNRSTSKNKLNKMGLHINVNFHLRKLLSKNQFDLSFKQVLKKCLNLTFKVNFYRKFLESRIKKIYFKIEVIFFSKNLVPIDPCPQNSNTGQVPSIINESSLRQIILSKSKLDF